MKNSNGDKLTARLAKERSLAEIRNPFRVVQTDTVPWRVGFYIVATKTLLVCDPRIPVEIGRKEGVADSFPQLDLTPFNGLELGVSRRHATLEIKAGDVILTDLGSTNGTTLNGIKMVAHQPYELSHMDVLHFGTMRIRISFLHSSQ